MQIKIIKTACILSLILFFNPFLEAQVLFSKQFIPFQKSSLKKTDSLNFQQYKSTEPLRLVVGIAHRLFQVKEYVVEDFSHGRYWEANLQLHKNFHLKNNYHWGCLTGLGLVYSTSFHASKRPIKSLGFPQDSLRLRVFKSTNLSLQMPLEINYTFYQKHNLAALRLNVGLHNRYALLRTYDSRFSIYKEGEITNRALPYPNESKEVFTYYVQKTRRFNVIPYAGIAILNKKGNAFWINVQYIHNLQIPDFEPITGKYGISLGSSTILR